MDQTDIGVLKPEVIRSEIFTIRRILLNRLDSMERKKAPSHL